MRDINIFEDLRDRSRLPLHSLYHLLPITEKPAQEAGFSASTPRLQKTLEDFWYNHLHNKHYKEEPEEDKVQYEDDLSP